MHLSSVISQRDSRLPPVPGLEGLPVVVRPDARLQGEAGFFAVEEHLEEDFRLAGGAVEDELEVRADAAGETRGENENSLDKAAVLRVCKASLVISYQARIVFI